MDQSLYQITCESCQGSRRVQLSRTPIGTTIDWLEDDLTPLTAQIVSFRERLDGEWGWQCRCGHNTLMTPQEVRTFVNPAAPKAEEMEQIVKNLQPAKVKAVADGRIVDGFKVVAV